MFTSLPTTYRAPAKVMINKLEKYPHIIQWNPTTHEVSVKGQRLKGRNVVDLISDVMRTRKTRMYKYFTVNNTRRYVEVLPKLVSGYNNTIHSSIGMAPINDEIYIRQKLYGKEKSVKSYKYQIGDHVRISKAKRQLKKGYLPDWTEEVFIITECKRLGTESYIILSVHYNRFE